MRERGFRFRRPTEEDIRHLAESIREDDRRELKRWTGQDAEYEIRRSVECSHACYAADFGDGSLACIFGACRMNVLEGEAVIWMLSSKSVERHPVEFYAGSKAGLDALCRAMPDVATFYNWVDTGYARACRWLERLGFDTPIRAALRAGVRGGTFRNYYYVNDHYRESED